MREFADRAHQRRREDDRGVLVHGDLDQGLEVAQLQRQRVSRHHIGGLRQLAGGERLALGGDDLGPLLALGLGLANHRALHAVGQLDAPELDDRDLDSPLFCLHVEDLADVLILDRDHRADRILDAVIGHGAHVDADVVLGDDPL
jgi:hypothetical protein